MQFAGGGFIFIPSWIVICLDNSRINLRKAGSFQTLPTLAGFVSDEGFFLLGPPPPPPRSLINTHSGAA